MVEVVVGPPPVPPPVGGGGAVGSVGSGSSKLSDGSISLKERCLIVKSASLSFDFIRKC
jgi:hypothetical protein